jgi:intracellular multiplication protein IcmP
MARNRGGSQQGGDENSEVMIVIASLMIAFAGWYLLHAKIAGFVLGLRQLEVALISLGTSKLDPIADWMRVIDRRVVTLSDLGTVSTLVGSYVRWIAVPVLAYMGVRLYRRSPTEKFKTVHTCDSLPLAVAHLYPWMKISTKLDFGRMDPDVGPWAYAKTERGFAREYKIWNERGEYNPDRAAEVFAQQLGTPWIGYTNLKPHAKALFAMLAARVNKDFGTSDDLLKQLAESAANGKVDYTGVDELAAKHKDTKLVRRVIDQHAYESTVLMQMLDRARGGATGKDYLPPNWFLWLKGVDRRLWYALSDVGRQTFHVESAGVAAHWLAERMRKKALQMPFVQTAVDGLKGELAKFTLEGDLEDDEGIVISAPDIQIKQAPVRKIPTPEEADRMRAERALSGASAPRIEDFPLQGK